MSCDASGLGINGAVMSTETFELQFWTVSTLFLCCSLLVESGGIVQNLIMVHTPVKRIAIIGLGPAGAIAIDAFAQEQAFDLIRIFERREAPGGCWLVFEC